MPFWSFRNAEDNEENGVLQIDGVLEVEQDWWGPSGQVIARNIRRHLDRVKDVTVYINSPGGDVMAGAEIYTALREHSANGKGRVTVKVSGIAASAASIVAMAGDEILMSPVAYMMIHNPWARVAGDAKEMRKTAKTLDVISEGLINAYQIRTGKSRDELKRMLEAETWMSAATCVTEGFADRVIGMEGAAAMALPTVRMSLRTHGAEEIAARFRAEEEPDEEPEDENPEETEEPEEPEDPEEETADPEEDPDDEDPEDPDEEPADEETDPEEDPEEDPEDEEPEDPDEEPEARTQRILTAAGRRVIAEMRADSEGKRRQEIAERARIMAWAAELAQG